MGYTHHWIQTRDLSGDEWEDVSADIKAILRYAAFEANITLANGAGEGGTQPEFFPAWIGFNGLGDDAHEDFTIRRRRLPKDAWEVRGQAFCKTDRKPYDAAVTAVLCYLATVTRRDDEHGEPIVGTEAFRVSSDGHGKDFLAGLEIARAALPRKANQLDLPMGVMQDDRWCAPWVGLKTSGYSLNFCVDGYAYAINQRGESYRFGSHDELADWLETNKRAVFARGGQTGWGSYGREEPDIWNATGSFDKARHDRIGRAQAKKLATLFPAPTARAIQPPAYVRPGDYAENGGRPFAYRHTDLLALRAAA